MAKHAHPKKKKQKGFTLIELLIVIGILGVLAAAVLVAVNPLEQFARGRDSGRKSTIGQIGRAAQAFYTSQNAYPTQNNTWMTTLQTAQELKTLPTNPTATGYVTTCTTGVAQGTFGWCYQTNSVDAVVYARAESNSEKLKANASTTVVCATTAWIVWSSAEGKTGLLCQAAEPAPGATGLR